ncbi:MAG: hypothetical protein O7C62_00480, partial [Rickettsia endosymbiont of Ixodes persulcatus]|nr:hypothetical protein [Rickettsia endosymbiont of Ixodes persulcatus]
MQTAKSTLKFKVPVSILTPLPMASGFAGIEKHRGYFDCSNFKICLYSIFQRVSLAFRASFCALAKA